MNDQLMERTPESYFEIGPETPTRDKLVLAARELFHMQGFEATSMAQILQKSGVNSGSLYYFFKSKDDLLLAVLELYTRLLHPVLIDPLYANVPDPLERVWALLDGYRQMLLVTGYQQGCPIGNLALEVGERSDAIREAIMRNFEGWRVAVRKCLQDAGERLPAELNRDQLATFILTVMEGAVMQSRSYRSIEPYDASLAMLRDYVSRLELSEKPKPT